MVATESRPKPNRYPGRCLACGQTVPAGAGQLIRKLDNGQWAIGHLDGGCGAQAAAEAAPVAAPAFAPTGEQEAALNLFRSGASMVIEAGAGTGKTSTLRLLAHSTKARGRYIAFNKAIVVDVQGSMPDNIAASTAHSLAFQAVGKRYAKRLKSGRMRSSEIAHRVGVERFGCQVGDKQKVLSEDYLGGLVMRAVTRFCQSAEERPGVHHVPYVTGIDALGEGGLRSYGNNNDLSAHLLPAVERAWADLSRTDGALPFRHDHYLKLWQLGHPIIDADFILFDEAQDANPVMAAVVGEQKAQRIYVGDSCQAIYEFTGAVNALAEIDADNRVFLTQSFRFGPKIADAANDLLGQLGADLTLRGLESIASTVGAFDGDPDAILTRTNAAAVDQMLAAQTRSVPAHLVGGGAEVLAFAKAASDLMAGRSTSHPELACFDSWGEVLAYVQQDEQGDELQLNVGLIEKYGVQTITRALDSMPREEDAALVVSTAHKAKGREWDRVRIGSDFVRLDGSAPSLPELRLQYVAVTRAKLALDNTALAAKEERP